ncbi:MAG: hypothetical protein NVS2B12_10270 [Ktedonobacteraceae bacterium]
MEEKTSNASVSAEPMPAVPVAAEPVAPVPASSAERATEHREAYGTAKTENLSDSGLWRFILPAAVVAFCIALIIIPLIILIPLLSNSIASANVGGKEGGLVWLWITMIILELAICAVIIRGLAKVFMTQAGNYR